MDDLFTEVAVIGAGVSALSVGLAASEKGLKVTLIDRTSRIGGVNDGLNGMFAVDTKLTRATGITEGIPYSKRDCFKAFMQHNHWNTDPRIVSLVVNKSAEVTEWLTANTGIEFVRFNDGATDHYIKDMEKWLWTDAPSNKLLKRFSNTIPEIMKQRGSEILLQTTVEEILMSDGRASGLRCRDNASGEEFVVHCHAVVCASGGYATNPDMIEENFGLKYGDNYRRMSGHTMELDGSGIKMCWAVGADKTGMALGHHLNLASPWDGPGGSDPYMEPFMVAPGIVVNADGERYLDEDILLGGVSREKGVKDLAFAANATKHQRDATCVIILSQTQLDQYFSAHSGVTRFYNTPYNQDVFLEKIREAESSGYGLIHVCETLDDIAEYFRINPDGLRSTVEIYNRYCGEGVDCDFYKNPVDLIPLDETGPYYCARPVISAYGTLGGVRVDRHGRALNAEKEPIPGLYCVGLDSEFINGDTYNMHSLNGIYGGYGYIIGREAGYDAARYIEKLRNYCPEPRKNM